MSYAGLTAAQLTPELLQQLQMQSDQQKQQAMAKALMNNQADPKTAYAGMANAGGELTGALTLKAMQDRQNTPANGQGGMTAPIGYSGGGISGQIPGMNIGTISGQTPSLGNNTFFGKMFGMGG